MTSSLVIIDVDEQPEIAAKYQIRAMPTVMAFKNGAPVSQFGELPFLLLFCIVSLLFALGTSFAQKTRSRRSVDADTLPDWYA